MVALWLLCNMLIKVMPVGHLKMLQFWSIAAVNQFFVKKKKKKKANYKDTASLEI